MDAAFLLLLTCFTYLTIPPDYTFFRDRNSFLLSYILNGTKGTNWANEHSLEFLCSWSYSNHTSLSMDLSVPGRIISVMAAYIHYIVTLPNSILRGSLPLVLVFGITLLSPLYLWRTTKHDPYFLNDSL